MTLDSSGTVSEILESSSYEFPAYLALLIPVYPQEDRPLSDVFRAPYVYTIPSLLSGIMTGRESQAVVDSFPSDVDAFFEPEFIHNSHAAVQWYEGCTRHF